jgi:ParB family chromosome partitioning protein
VPGLIDRVDEKKIKVVAGVELSYLSRKDQALVIEGIERNDNPLPAQAKLLRAAGESGSLTPEKVDAILARGQKQPNGLKLADSLIRQYVPPSYTPKQMQTVIVKLLEVWHKNKAG